MVGAHSPIDGPTSCEYIDNTKWTEWILMFLLLLLFKIEHKIVRETHGELEGEELEKVMSRYDFMYTLVHICEFFKEYLVRCLSHQCERIWHWMMSSMHICLSGQAYILSSEKTEFNPWSSLAIQTSLITKSLVPITPSLQNHKIWLSEMTLMVDSGLHRYIQIYMQRTAICVCVYVYICMQIYTHKNCQPYQKQYSFIVSVLARCKLCHIYHGMCHVYQVNCAIVENHLKH